MTKQERILASAEKLFTTHRFHEVTLDRVCQAAGVGKGTIYRYFANKDELFLHVVISGFHALSTVMAESVSNDASFEDQLTQILENGARLLVKKRHLFRLMQMEETRLLQMRSAVRKEWMTHRDRIQVDMTNWVRKGVSAGYVRNDLSPDTIAACLLGMLRGAVSRVNALEDNTAPLSELATLFMQGVATNGAKCTS